MNYGCNGRRAVISGGTSGIGLAAAGTLLADGAEVWLLEKKYILYNVMLQTLPAAKLRRRR